MNVDSLNIGLKLPENLIIQSSGYHLYKIGLLKKPFEEKKWNRYNPIIPIVIIGIIITKCFLSLTFSESDQRLLIYIGDWSYFIPGIRIHLNLFVINFWGLSLVSQLICLLRKGYTQSWLKPFSMMSGIISPKSIELLRAKDVKKLLKRTKILFFMASMSNNVTVPSFVFIASGLTLAINCSLLDFLKYGLFWSILFSISSYFAISIICWQIVYFHIICLYLKLKIQNINNEINLKLKLFRNRLSNIKSIIELYDGIRTEVNRCDKEYWALFAMLLYSFYVPLVCFILYQVMYGGMNLLIRFLFSYACLMHMILFSNFILSAALVNAETNFSYKLLNKCFICSKFEITKNLIKVNFCFRK